MENSSLALTDSISETPLSHLFASSDKILTCNLQKNGGQTQQKIYKMSEFEDNGINREFFCLNPIKGSRNLKSQVGAYRNFLYESDSLPIETQFALLPTLIELDIFASITFSGGKSLHCIVSTADTLDLGEPGSDEANHRYKQIWEGLRQHIEAAGLTGIDPTNSNPTTLTRLPNAVRASNNTVQKLLHVGPLLPAEVVRAYCKVSTKSSKQIIIPVEFSGTFNQFETLLWRTENQNFFRYFLCPNWVSTANNYIMLRRLCWWAVDAFNCSEELFMSLVQKYLEPEFAAMGYYRNNTKRVHQLFKWKRLKDKFDTRKQEV